MTNDSREGERPENWTYLLEKEDEAEESCGENSSERFLRCCLGLGGILIESDLGMAFTWSSALLLAMILDEYKAKAIAMQIMREKADDIAELGDAKKTKRISHKEAGVVM